MTKFIDFNDLSAGTVVDNAFQADGVTISATGGSNLAMIFDTENPSDNDNDLETTNLGKALIISANGDSSDPDDEADGGTFTFLFDTPSVINRLTFLDIEEGATVRFYTADGTLIDTVQVDATDDNGQLIQDFDVSGVARMEVTLGGSGAIDNLVFDDSGLDVSGLDGVVEGDDDANLIDDSYVDDPEGDRIDAGDAVLPGEGENDDIVDAFGGDDTVLSGAADDKVYAGSGNDSVEGGAGDDLIVGDSNYSGPGAGTSVRESFQWSEAGLSDTDTISGFTQDTGNVDVTFTILDEIGGAFSEYSTIAQNISNIDDDGTTPDASSSLDSGLKAASEGADYQLEFSDPVEEVSFRINDIDGDAVVKVTAYDADGNATVVNLEGGANLTLSDTDDVAGNDTANSNEEYLEHTSSEYSVLVSIPGPVSKIVIEHDQDGDDNTGIGVTDVYFDVPHIDNGPVGDDTLVGGEGADTIYGDYADSAILSGENLITNGSFEIGQADNTAGNADNQDGWYNNGDTVNHIETWGDGLLNVTAPEGSNFVELDVDDQVDSLAQDIITTDGETYQLSVSLRQRATGNDDEVEIHFGGQLVAVITPEDDWTEYTFIVTGSGSDTLEFREPSTDNDSFGPLIDDVQLYVATYVEDSHDSIVDGAGDDVIEGGDDSILGGAGDDVIDGGEGDDTIDGGDDDDVIAGGRGSDSILGGEGADEITAGNPDDDLLVDKGYPGVFAGEEGTPAAENDRDFVDGGAGNDTISTGDDRDTIEGGTGDDVIDGGIDDDFVLGGDGADRIVGGEGSDTLSGGQGNDTIFAGNDPDLGLDFLNIEDDGSNPFGPDLLPDNGVDEVDGGAGNDLIFGADDGDSLSGGAGNDTIDGEIDDDTIFGGDGNDSLIGGQGDDDVEGGSGDDTLDGGDGNDTLVGNADSDLFVNVNAGDVVDGSSGRTVDGSDFDTLDLTGSAPDGGRLEIVIDGEDSNGNGFDGRVNYFDADGNDAGTLEFTEIEDIIPCFTPGTMIATASGERLVQDLKVGDRIITRDNGIQEIRWVGQREMSGDELNRAAHLRPVLIRQGALGKGLPERDMLVSPQHRVLMSSDKTALYFDEGEVLVAAKHLTHMEGIDVVDVSGTTYIHVMFDQHEVILSDGAWTESFQPGDQTLATLGDAQRAEIFELFPELETQVGVEAYTAARRSLKKHEAKLLSQ